MKRFCVLVFLLSIGYNVPTRAHESETLLCLEQALYSYTSTAATRNTYGRNDSIKIEVFKPAAKTKKVSYVKVKGRRVKHTLVFGEKNTYRFTYSNKTFYFTVE